MLRTVFDTSATALCTASSMLLSEAEMTSITFTSFIKLYLEVKNALKNSDQESSARLGPESFVLPGEAFNKIQQAAIGLLLLLGAAGQLFDDIQHAAAALLRPAAGDL
jgi:hypothetical protein